MDPSNCTPRDFDPLEDLYQISGLSRPTERIKVDTSKNTSPKKKPQKFTSIYDYDYLESEDEEEENEFERMSTNEIMVTTQAAIRDAMGFTKVRDSHSDSSSDKQEDKIVKLDKDTRRSTEFKKPNLKLKVAEDQVKARKHFGVTEEIYKEMSQTKQQKRKSTTPSSSSSTSPINSAKNASTVKENFASPIVPEVKPPPLFDIILNAKRERRKLLESKSGVVPNIESRNEFPELGSKKM